MPVRLCNYVDVYRNDRIRSDMAFMSATATPTEIARFGLRVGDVIITKDSEDRTDIAVSSYVSDTAPDIVCGYHLAILRARPALVHGNFLFWAIQSKQAREAFSNAAEGVTRFGLTLDGVKSISLPHPDLMTQKAIADFLDRETARIDRLIKKKQRLVEVVRERSLSAIERAVSAEAYLSKLGHHVKVLPGYAFASSGFSHNEEETRLLRGANVSPGKIRWDDVVHWPTDATRGLDRFQLEVGDIVMGMDRPWISSGMRVAEVTEHDVPALLLQRVCKIIPLKSLSKEFLKLLLSSKKFLGYFEPELTGVSVPHISGDQIAGFRFPYLPVPQQVERATACRKVLSSNEVITERVQKSISRLQEFRSALITVAITGQFDIATWRRQGRTDQHLDQLEEQTPA